MFSLSSAVGRLFVPVLGNPWTGDRDLPTDSSWPLETMTLWRNGLRGPQVRFLPHLTSKDFNTEVHALLKDEAPGLLGHPQMLNYFQPVSPPGHFIFRFFKYYKRSVTFEELGFSPFSIVHIYQRVSVTLNSRAYRWGEWCMTYPWEGKEHLFGDFSTRGCSCPIELKNLKRYQIENEVLNHTHWDLRKPRPILVWSRWTTEVIQYCLVRVANLD